VFADLLGGRGFWEAASEQACGVCRHRKSG
jgi:hypothetical protein